jgi:hypothetical protein
MPATSYVTLDDLVQNLIYQCEPFALLIPLIADLEAFRLVYVTVLGATMTRDDVRALNRQMTGCISAMSSDLNCYPIGSATTICFDSSGNVVP